MSRPLVMLVLLMQFIINASQAVDHPDICERDYCECTPASHPNWLVVNCTLSNDQELDISEGELPDTTTDLIITGAQAVTINPNALSRLSDARLVHISDTKSILIRKSSAMRMNIVNLYLDISKCEVLRFEERSFINIKDQIEKLVDI
ncbi:uncharacterized protein LOC111000824 [Pieris rapae]|uniref:uncharacterized protein LOC111000824 n=1 Tax=Pieris rapae TaxID=64459 RepID=UPI001E27A55A|nr:uncharacterized protein LOC111000824 [Pieris rapae]